MKISLHAVKAVLRCSCISLWRKQLSALVLVGVWGLAGCSGAVQVHYEIDELLNAGRYLEADKLVQEKRNSYGKRDEVLWLLDRGVLLYYQGKYKESIQAFNNAERRMDELFQISLSQQAASLLVNDNITTYAGEDFENVMLNIYKALSFAQLGNFQGAQVESRKLNEKLNYIRSKQQGLFSASYQEDAFARLLSGVFYELGGRRADLNDAFISNKKSLELYQGEFGKRFGVVPPNVLKANLLATAPILGQREFNRWRKRFPKQKFVTIPQRRNHTRVYFVHFAGKPPQKENVFIPYLYKNYQLNLAVPAYKKRSYRIDGSRIIANNKPITRLESVHPTGEIASRNLNDRYPLILARAAARQVARNAVVDNDNQGSALAALVGNLILERADLRSWQTLPDKVLFSQAWLPAGSYRFQAQLLDKSGKSIGSRDLGELTLTAGRARFLIFATR